MSGEQAADPLRWYAVHTHPRQEDRAESNFRVWGVETLNPKIKVRRFNRYSSVLTHSSKPLFPQYIFARFSAQKLFTKVYFTRGVHSIVGFGRGPTPIDDEIITIVSSRIGEDGFVRLDEGLKPGDKVKIKGGPLSNLTGIFDRPVKDTARVMILLEAVSYQNHVVIEKDLVEKMA